MVADRQNRVVTVGGKGSLLTSASVFEIANALSHLAIDASSQSRLLGSSSSSAYSETSTTSADSTAPFDYLTPEECRATLLVLLNKHVLLSNSSSAAVVVSQIYDILQKAINDVSQQQNDYTVFGGVSSNDISLSDYSSAAIDAISALLDHHSSSLFPLADAFAALSCEALRADISPFNLIDSGDGSSAKDDVAVASDFKVFFNGSKFMNGKFMDPAVSMIPTVHGSFREVSRLLHSRTRVQLNSPLKATSGSSQAMCTTLSSLALSLWNLGDISSRRAKLLVDSMPLIGNELLLWVKPANPDSLGDIYMSSQAALRDKDYLKFAHYIYSLLETVRKIVSWEGLVAFFALEGIDLVDRTQIQGTPTAHTVNGENSKISSKKSEKKKKVLGRGTSALVQFIKDKLLSGASEAVPVEKLAQNFISFLDPKDLGFDDLLKKLKEIVESNESRRLPKLPKGTRDFAKEQMTVREKAFSIIVEVFKRHGATALDTPAFEMRETLTGKYGEDSKLIYDLADQGGELCSLRYDLTVPFARYVAMNGLTSFKRYQIAKVYRRDNPSKGRYREFYQCDFDIAGQYEKMGPDFEVIKILTELLNELDIGDYEVKLNHRKLLDGMLAVCGVPQEKFRTICSSIDKLDKQPFDQIKKEMVVEKGLTEAAADKIGSYVKERGSPMVLLSKLKQEGSEFLHNSDSLLALNELETLFRALEKSRCIDKVVFDLSLARGLDYYTGVIFEAVFKGAAQVGSIAAGGRYDNLIGMFGTKQVPAVGISLGIERVFVIMEQLQKDKNEVIRATETQVLVSILGDDLSVGAELVSELWDAKLKAEYMVNKRVMKHIDRAKESRIPFMVIVGEREINEGIVKLKDVVAANECSIPRNELVQQLRARLNISFP